MPRVASLCLPQLPIERLWRAERPRALPDPATRASLPIDAGPGACSAPRGGCWRPGARWAREDDHRAEVALAASALPAYQQPPMRELGRRSEAAVVPFRQGASAVKPAPATSMTYSVAAPLVLAIRTGQTERVHAACPQALALGLLPGSAVAQARAMVPQLDVREADPEADRRLLDRLARHAVRHWTPMAAVSGIDGIWLDLAVTAHLFGGEARFCRLVTRFCARLGLTVRVAVADTPGAAHALARFAGDAAVITARGGTVEALAPLPVAALRLDHDALAACQRFGIERIADLLPIPRAPLTRRLGRDAVTRLDQAVGRVAEPIVPIDLPAALLVERRLLEPVSTREALDRIVDDLARDLAETLRARGLGARSLALAFVRVDGAEQRVSAGMARATRNAPHLARLLKLRLETVDPGLGIEAARLGAPRHEPLGALALASPLAGEAAPPDLAPLVDQLAGRVGETALFHVAAHESDVPERAVRRVPALAAGGHWPGWGRPARLLRRPEPLSLVVALLPDHPPRRLAWRGATHIVVAGDGPERIHGEWWRNDREVWAVRDYYRVEDAEGGRFWLFRRGDGVEVATGDLSWWMHGVGG